MTLAPAPISARTVRLLQLWFGSLDPLGLSPPSNRKRWFTKDPAFDRELDTDFGDLVVEASRGALDSWSANNESAVALILLLDQLPRNIYRGTAAMFESDPAAVQQCASLIDAGRDREMPFDKRAFVYMPLMHSESLAAQTRCVALFEGLAAEFSEVPRAAVAARGSVDFARRHAAIVERFGRFPHRNEVLGRRSTPEEEEFLKRPDSSF